MKIKHGVSFAATCAIVVFAVYYLAALGVRTGPPDDRVNLSMQVADTNGLAVGCNVLLRGVAVGKVTKIHSTVSGAAIDFYVDRQTPIPADSEVRLENLSALGESYIALMPRTASGPMLHNGQQVASKDIKQPASISELAANVVRVFRQADPSRLGRLVDVADRALPDPDTVTPNLTRGSKLLRNIVVSMNGRGSEVLSNAQTLLQNAGWVGPVLAEISPEITAAAGPIGELEGLGAITFGSLGGPQSLKEIGRFLDLVEKFLETRGPDLKVIGQSLLPYMQGISASLMNFDAGQILSNVLAGVPADGLITLHLTVPNR